jgi:hypothetical protein
MRVMRKERAIGRVCGPAAREHHVVTRFRYFPVFTSSIARAINSSMVRRIW